MTTNEMTKAMANSAGIVVSIRKTSVEVFIIPCTKDFKAAGKISEYFVKELQERGYGETHSFDMPANFNGGQGDDSHYIKINVGIPEGQEPAAFADKLAKDMGEITDRNDIPNLGRASEENEKLTKDFLTSMVREAEKQTKSSCGFLSSSLPVSDRSEARTV